MKTMITAVLALSLLAVPAAEAATQANPSAKQREHVIELLRLTKADQLATGMLDNFFEQMQKQAAESVKSDPDATAEVEQLFTRLRQLASKLDLSDLQESQVRSYAKFFTEKELEELVAFHRSPTGQKQTEVLPALTAEMMTLGAEKIGPKINAIFEEARADIERSKPWRGTMKSMITLGTAIEVYAEDHDGLYPRSLSFAALLQELDDEELASKDVWENGFAYVVSPDAKHYRLISAGADANFEFDSRTIVPAKADEQVATRYRERLEDDIIYADGAFVQAPKVAAPKNSEPK